MAAKQKTRQTKSHATRARQPKRQTKRVRGHQRKTAGERQKDEKAARDRAVKNGQLLVVGKKDYVLSENGGDRTLDKRAEKVLRKLEQAKRPVLGKELQKEFGGGWPLYIPMFSMLKAQGLIHEYRLRTGKRGGGKVAYLHVKHAPKVK